MTGHAPKRADARQRGWRMTVSRKTAIVATLLVTLSIGTLIVIAGRASMAALDARAYADFKSMTALLAPTVSGGLKWNKPDVVEKAYKDFAAADGSSIAAVVTFARDGAPVTRFASDRYAAFDVEAAMKGASVTGTDPVVRRSPDHLLVIQPVAAGTDVVGTLAIAWSLESVKSESSAILSTLLATAGIAIALLVAALVLVLGRLVGAPLGQLCAAMSAISEGNLATDVPYANRQDDMGDMARALAVFKSNAAEMRRLEAEKQEAEARARSEAARSRAEFASAFERSVLEVMSEVETTASRVRSVSATLADSAEATRSDAISVATAAGRSAEQVQSVASMTAELSTSISEISTQASRASSIVTTTRSKTDAARKVVSALKEAAERISNVVDMITQVTEQTNLLALNATIEAARAGESGRGFAVVANEVKALARQTASATGDISRQISAVQSTTDQAVAAIEDIVTAIGDMDETVASVSAAVEEQSAVVHEIAQSTVDVAKGTSTVSGGIDGVRVRAQENGTSASQALKDADTLREAAARLRTEAQAFVAKVRAA